MPRGLDVESEWYLDRIGDIVGSMTTLEIHDKCWSSLGMSLVYMDFFNSDIDWEPQRGRVVRLCDILTSLKPQRFPDDTHNRTLFAEFLLEIQDEVENQC